VHSPEVELKTSFSIAQSQVLAFITKLFGQTHSDTDQVALPFGSWQVQEVAPTNEVEVPGQAVQVLLAI
jgi:hypothetical protein